jgi:hypothetical protein
MHTPSPILLLHSLSWVNLRTENGSDMDREPPEPPGCRGNTGGEQQTVVTGAMSSVTPGHWGVQGSPLSAWFSMEMVPLGQARGDWKKSWRVL